jgi:hypothetical protein
MEGSENRSLATLIHLLMKEGIPARNSSVSSVSSCKTLLFKILNRRQQRVSNGGIGEPPFGHSSHLLLRGQKATKENARSMRPPAEL